MGCGGSKAEESKTEEKKGKGKTTPRRRSVGSNTTESSPQRREPRQKKPYVSKRRETEPIVTVFQRSIPAESENLPLTGNWELENGTDVSTCTEINQRIGTDNM